MRENVPLVHAVFSVSAPPSLTVAPASQEPENVSADALETSGQDAGAVRTGALGAAVSRIQFSAVAADVFPAGSVCASV